MAQSAKAEAQMINVKIDTTKLKNMETKLNCKFGNDGQFVEMALALNKYQEQLPTISGVSFGVYSGDLEKLRKLVEKVDPKWCKYFTENMSIFCGFVKEEPVSFCIVTTTADSILSDDKLKIGGVACVGTVPDYRKHGIGLKMVDMATMHLKSQGCDIAYIHYTHLEKWYKKLGYETIARFSII